MSRVLITGGGDPLGRAVARRLLADPGFELRIADPRPLPQWMREGCEVHDGDMRAPAQALAATRGCTHVIHLAQRLAAADGASDGPHTLLERSAAGDAAVVAAALKREVERFLLVSSPAVFERATLFPTPEEHLLTCAAPRSAGGLAALWSERLCHAAHEERGLALTICRPWDDYGGRQTGDAAIGEPAGLEAAVAAMLDAALVGEEILTLPGSPEQTRTPTHVEDLADGVAEALRAPAALNQDFNLGAAREVTLEGLAKDIWRACERDPRTLELRPAKAGTTRAETTPTACALQGALRDGLFATPPQRSWPAVQKARERLGWSARIGLEEGLATAAAARREGLGRERPSVAAAG